MTTDSGVRLQFDISRAQFNIMNRLAAVCGLGTRAEVFSNSIVLMKWAAKEVRKGRKIASYDPVSGEIGTVDIPALNKETPND